MKEITFNKREAKAIEALIEMQIDMIESEGEDVIVQEPELRNELENKKFVDFMRKYVHYILRKREP